MILSVNSVISVVNSFSTTEITEIAEKRKRTRGSRVLSFSKRKLNYALRCLLTRAVISNIETCFLPPKIFFRLSSALIMRLFC